MKRGEKIFFTKLVTGEVRMDYKSRDYGVHSIECESRTGA
jgi:hypothetical protein